MAKQAVGIGTSANDGTGDSLRTAFTKTNANFTELYNMQETASILNYGSPARNGLTDDSAVIASADVAAAADGFRYLYFPAGTYYAPSLTTNPLCIWVGPGVLRGSFNRSIAPVHAPTFPASLSQDIIPSQHLKAFSRARFPVVVYIGDSTFTQAADGLSQGLYAFTEIRRRIQECNNNVFMQHYNRAIPGTSQYQINQVISSNLPSWYTVPGAAWPTYVQNLAPDLIIIGFGMNGGDVWSPHEMRSFITTTQGFAKVPDIVFCTPLVPSLKASGNFGTAQEQSNRNFAAGWVRSFCKAAGYGLIDFNRVNNIIRDGLDYTDTEATTVTEVYNGVLPYTCSQSAYDFNMQFTFVGQRNTIVSGGANVSMTIGGLSTNRTSLQIGTSGGFWSLSIYDGPDFFGGFTSGVAPSSGDLIVKVECRGAWLYVNVDGIEMWNGLIPRYGGPVTPVITRSASPGSYTVRVDNMWIGYPKQYKPTSLDQELWREPNSPTGPWGGAKNHPTSLGVSRIYKAVLDCLNFARAGTGQTQVVGTTSTVTAGVNLVQLTPPAAGNYAITLNAPTVDDLGKVLMFETVAKPGTGNVTVALTNVDGGTASTTATFTNIGDKLVLYGGTTKWTVVKQLGVVLT